jgi:hypothetical protein
MSFDKPNKLTLTSLEDHCVYQSLNGLSLNELITLKGQISVIIDRKCHKLTQVAQEATGTYVPAPAVVAANERVENPINKRPEPTIVAPLVTRKCKQVGDKLYRIKKPKFRSLEYRQSNNWLERARSANIALASSDDVAAVEAAKFDFELAKEYSFLVRQNIKAGMTAIRVDTFRKLVHGFGIVSLQDLKKARQGLVNLVPLTITVSTAKAVTDEPTDKEGYIGVYSDLLVHWTKDFGREMPGKSFMLFIHVDNINKILLKKQLLIKEDSDNDSKMSSGEAEAGRILKLKGALSKGASASGTQAKRPNGGYQNHHQATDRCLTKGQEGENPPRDSMSPSDAEKTPS